MWVGVIKLDPQPIGPGVPGNGFYGNHYCHNATPGNTRIRFGLKPRAHGVRQRSFKATVQRRGATRVSDQRISIQRYLNLHEKEYQHLHTKKTELPSIGFPNSRFGNRFEEGQVETDWMTPGCFLIMTY